MALSNWDTLAFDKDGKPTNGIFTNGDISVEIYKNWLYVHDKKGWTAKNCGFRKDTIARIGNGEIQYKNVHILAKRGRQESVMCIVWTDDYEKKDKNQYEVMVGCGVYGYRGSKWVGVEGKTFEALKIFAKDILEEYIGDSIVTFPDNPLRFNQGDAYFAGVTKAAIPATEPSKSEEPILTKLLKQ